MELEELCKEDGVMSSEFKKAVKLKGSEVYCGSVIGLIKISKSQFDPKNGVYYTVIAPSNN